MDEYSNLTDKNLRDEIDKNKDLEEDFKECMFALIDCASDLPTYFAKQLHEYLNYKYGKNFLTHYYCFKI